MALSLKKINSSWLLLGAALLLGGGAAYLGGAALEQRMQELDAKANAGLETVAVVVAKRDMQRGEPISPDSFAVRKVPTEYLNADAVRPADFEGFLTQRLIVGLKRGDVLLPVHTEGNGNKVFSSTLGVGKRALTFEVDTVNSVSGMLRPGDRIDLIYTTKGSDTLDVTQPLLSNLEILATDQVQTRRDEEGKERSFSTITMELTPQDAQRIIVAKQAGRLTALLRHPDDKAANPSGAMDATVLLTGRVRSRSGEQQGIEYLVGGGGGPASIQTQLSRLALGGTSPTPAVATAPVKH